jgi:hypothetical protein
MGMSSFYSPGGRGYGDVHRRTRAVRVLLKSARYSRDEPYLSSRLSRISARRHRGGSCVLILRTGWAPLVKRNLHVDGKGFF